MSHGEFLASMRVARGHLSAEKLAEYARTRGHSLTGQAIRNYESGRIPNEESRDILGDILHLNAENKERLRYLCAISDLHRRWPDLDAIVIDKFTRKAIAQRCVAVADSEHQSHDYHSLERATERVMDVLCSPKV